MRLAIERAHLLKSLSHVHRVVERRNTIPILSNVLLRAREGAIEVKATDLDLEVVEKVVGEVQVPGATTVPAHTLYDIVRKLPDGAEIALETQSDQNALILRAGRSRFSLPTLPEADFPDLAAGEMSHRFSLAADDLRRLVERTQFAISTEETRYYLNGIYLHAVESGRDLNLRAVATDGHRLAQAEMKAPSGAEGMPGVIVPRKTVGEALKLVDDLGGTVEVELSASKLRLTFPGLVLSSKLIDGTFPDYARVIPRGNDKRLVVQKRDFVEAVDRVSTVSSERGRAVKLALNDGRMVLTVFNPDQGSATEEITVDYEAPALDIGFNARYLLDIAAQLETDEARFLFADPGSPTLIEDNSQSGSTGALYVLMPMRV